MGKEGRKEGVVGWIFCDDLKSRRRRLGLRLRLRLRVLCWGGYSVAFFRYRYVWIT